MDKSCLPGLNDSILIVPCGILSLFLPGQAESFHLLHLFVGKQPCHFAFWRVTADEINYRRFFDINDLAGLRIGR